jgi:hypothetical protein
MTDSLTIAPRFRGPQDSSNGGYAGRLIAVCTGGPVAVTLRRPLALATATAVGRGKGPVRARDGHRLSSCDVGKTGRWARCSWNA